MLSRLPLSLCQRAADRDAPGWIVSLSFIDSSRRKVKACRADSRFSISAIQRCCSDSRARSRWLSASSSSSFSAVCARLSCRCRRSSFSLRRLERVSSELRTSRYAAGCR